MPTLSVTKNYLDTTVLTEAQLDAAFESIETFINTTKLDEDNLADSSVGTSELQANAVTTAKIIDGAVTDAKVQTGGLTSTGLASASVLTATIASGAVTTDKLSTTSVTHAKLAARSMSSSTATAGNVAISSSSGSFTTTSTSFTDVTSLSVTITSTGRPIRVCLINDGSSSSNSNKLSSLSSNDTTTSMFTIVRDSTEVAYFRLNLTTLGCTLVNPSIPLSSVDHVDAPAAGTYTYKLQAKVSGTATAGVYNAKLIAYEI